MVRYDFYSLYLSRLDPLKSLRSFRFWRSSLSHLPVWSPCSSAEGDLQVSLRQRAPWIPHRPIVSILIVSLYLSSPYFSAWGSELSALSKGGRVRDYNRHRDTCTLRFATSYKSHVACFAISMDGNRLICRMAFPGTRTVLEG